MDERTISECLNSIAAKYPDKEAVTDMGVSYTWKQIQELTNHEVLVLQDKEIKKGTHVAIWVDNSVNWIVLYLALQQLGAVTALLNVAYKWRELETALENCDVEYIFYSAQYRDSDHIRTIRELNRNRLSAFKEGFLIQDEPVCLPQNMSGIDCESEKTDSDNVSNILFTSGTTKAAKGVMLTDRNIVNNSLAIVKRLKWTAEDRMCFAVPMYHCFGVTVGILGALHTGASIHIVRSFKSESVFEVIEEHKCTIFNGVPTMFLAMKNSQLADNYDLSSLKGGLMAGSAILPAEYIEICKKFGLERLNTAFGQTESSPAITVSEDSDSKEIRSNSSGRVLPDIELRIMKNSSVMGCMEEGEIQTRGYHVMKGYYNMPEETLNTLDTEGWLSTGDLGYVDEQGYLHVTGRIKDIIVRGGENISPVEIEQVLCQLPNVMSVKVVGIPAPVIQEEVVACIIWKDNEPMDSEYVRSFVRSQLADYKVPKYILDYMEFPMNSSGKILSAELSEISRKRIEQK